MRIREVFGLGVLACAVVVPGRLWAQAPQPTPAPAAPATTEVPAPTSRVAAVLGRDGAGTDLTARLTAAQALGNELQPVELAALYAFMARKAGEDALPVDKLAVIKNDVANALLNQTRPPREFGPCLVRMFSDRTHDTLWRDFCAQFLGRWYPRTSGDERVQIRDVLWQATAETDTQVAGTALIALRDNVGQGDIDKDRLARRACDLAADAKVCEPVRVTALQVGAGLGHQPALALAREIVNGNSGACLKMSAVAAIGMLGDASDLACLERLSQSPDVRLRNAATSARQRCRGSAPDPAGGRR